MNELTYNPLPQTGQLSPEMLASSEPPMILYYLDMIKRRKWLLVGCVVAAALVGLLITFLMTPQYTAETKLEIRRENYQIVNVQGVEPEDRGVDLEFYETQWGLLSSDSLAERVVTQLRLQDNPTFFELFGEAKIADEIRDGGRNLAAGGRRQELVQVAADILLDHVEIAPARLSRLADVRFTSPDPNLSAQIANAWAQAFIEISLERRFEATSYARNFLEERLEQLRERLQDSERALVSYAARERIINVPGSSTTGSEQANTATERPLVAEDLSALNRELNDAISARIAAESRLRGTGSSVEALNNQAITDLRSRRAVLASDYARLVAQFEPSYPPAEALADQIAEIDRAITREEVRVRTTLQDAAEAAAAREALLRNQVQALKSDLLDLRGRTIQYNIFQRDVDTNRQLYDALLQRYKEIGVAGGVGVNNISIVDAARVPEKPSSPNLLLNMLLSVLVGAILGVVAVLALEQVDQTISDPRSLDAALGLPLLGVIPKSATSDPTEELADPKSALVEAYLSAQTRLAFTTAHGVPRSIAVTSTRPGEGKSTTAHALARQLGRVGKRVVLIDADMRSPSVHLAFGIPGEPGLSNLLAGADDTASMIHETANGLSVLPAGPVPPNAAELLAGDRFRSLMGELLANFDHVVVDAPPVMGLADTPLVGSMVEGVVFVVESHVTSSSLAKVAVSRLLGSHAKLLGALLTKFEAQKAQYGYGYGYEYGYGYGKVKDDSSVA